MFIPRGPNGVTWLHLSLERSSSLSCERNWTHRDTGADTSTYVSLAGGDSLSRPLSLHPPVQRISWVAMHFEMCRVTKDSGHECWVRPCRSGCDVIGQPAPPLNWARRGQCDGSGLEAGDRATCWWDQGLHLSCQRQGRAEDPPVTVVELLSLRGNNDDILADGGGCRGRAGTASLCSDRTSRASLGVKLFSSPVTSSCQFYVPRQRPVVMTSLPVISERLSVSLLSAT